MDYLKIENLLCFPIYALSRQITSLYRPHLEKLGLTYPQYLVMLVLWEHKQMCVKEIGEILLLDSGTLTPLLKRMEESGWIIRKRSSKDERLLLVKITNKGKLLEEETRPVPELLKNELGADDRQLLSLQKQLKQLLEVVSSKCKNQK